MAPQSSSSSSFYEFTYDVFLSFRGFDTRYGFTGNLCNALRDKGIRTFMDDKELERGKEITLALRKAIEDSRIAIIVFSKNYAESSFCLDELVHILFCLDSSKPEEARLVLPIFYDVEPTHLRHHTGSYGKAIAEHEERFQNNTASIERLQNWKMALNQAANLSGHTFTTGKEYEYKFVAEIVDFINSKINRTPLHVEGNCVGLESRLQKVISLLNLGSSDEVCIVGIHGIGGIGKTTLAREIYNSIANQFKVLCFLDDVRRMAHQDGGLLHLQETLLATLGHKDIKLGSVSQGTSMIKRRLNTMKVLLILDDVDELKQLKFLAGGHDWFGCGSRVIITTRDKQLLVSHKIERIYEVEELSEDEAFKLLVQKAFKDNNFEFMSYKDVLKRAVTYASGLPLALEVLGSNLSGENCIEEWESLLDQYERIPNKEIQTTLQVSFEALEEEYQSVFLDIACCFKGYDLAELECILRAHHGHCIKNHIRVLVAKSLVKITRNDIVTLHDLIEDMGKEIVRKESPNEPGKRRSLWFHKDIVPVLQENTGTRKIEIIHLDGHLSNVVINWNGEAFKKMRNIKTLIIKNKYIRNFFEGPKHFPSSLRVLEWEDYPSHFIPSIFLNKVFDNMTVLKFKRCEYLTDIPNVFSLPNLEIFSFPDCTNLVTIHESVGFLSKLKVLDVWGCTKLKSFPPIIKLPSLQALNLSDCRSLESFPEISGEMKNITELYLDRTSIKVLPSSFQNLTGLCNLHILRFGLRLPISALMMSSLSKIIAYNCQLEMQNDNTGAIVSSNVKVLHLIGCHLTDEILLTVLKLFVNVEELNIGRNSFRTLPECIKERRCLRKLVLYCCPGFDQIQGLPPNLKYLNAKFCSSSTFISSRSLLMNQKLHEDGGTYICFPSKTASIPQWFEHQSKGMSIPFWFRNNIPSIVLLIHIKATFGFDSVFETPHLHINGYRFHIYPLDDINRIVLEHTYVYDVRLQDRGLLSRLHQALSKNEWLHAEIVFEVCHGPRESETPRFLIESGVHVLKQSMKDVRFTDPYKGKRKLDAVMCPAIDEGTLGL